LRGASSGTATFPFWPGQHNLFFSFFLFFSVIYIFAFALSLRLIWPPPQQPTFGQVCVLLSHFVSSPGTWHLESGPLAAPPARLLCAVRLFAEKRFIYLFMFRKDQKRAILEVLFFPYLVRSCQLAGSFRTKT